MKSTPTPHVATGTTVEELTVTFGATGCTKHTVTIPSGTRCRKLDGGSDPWVIADISFISDKNSLMHHDANYYGIRIPEDKIVNIQNTKQ